LVALSFVALATSASAQVRPDRAIEADIARLTTSIRAQLGAGEDAGRGRMITALIHGPVSAGALRAMGATVGTQAGGITTVRIPLRAAPQIARLRGVESIRLATPIQLDNDLSIPDTRANLKRTQVPPYVGFNGNGVILGEVDSGIEYQHDDFKNPDGSTRILSIWDQTGAGSPPTYGYGNECTQAQISAGTCSETDIAGHGTHTSGSAAGDGSATGNSIAAGKYSGMANKASIIMVKTNFTDAGIIDGVDYIFQKAAALGMPAVVNLSLGTNLGPHDGTSDMELALQALVGTGKIIVASAGNDQADQQHGVLTAKTALDSLTFAVPAYSAAPGTLNDYFLLDGWYKRGDNFNLTIVTPSNITIGPIQIGKNNGVYPGQSTADGNIYVENGDTTDTAVNNGDKNVYIEVSDLAAVNPHTGGWRIRMTPVSVGASSLGQIHFWSFSTWGGTQHAYFATKSSSDMTVGAPSTADSILCVGAHTTKVSWTSSAPGQPGPWSFNPAETLNQLCSFSGNGPRRDGVMKPDLTAPGSAIASALSTAWVAQGAAGGWSPLLAADDGKHGVLQGTSMAAPHVSGAIAMMLQQNHNLNPTLARQILEANTRRDSPVTSAGTVPNKKFGWGKLDLTNVLPNVDTTPPTVTVTKPNGGETWSIGAQDSVRWTASDNIGVTAIDLEYSPDNGLNWNPIASGLANSGLYLWSVPNDPSTQAKVRITAHDSQNQAQDLSNAVFTISATTGVGDAPALAFAVHHAMPSPFTGSTTVGFDLPSAPAGQTTWRTTARIYNLAGKLVRTALSADLAPGTHTALWDGRDEHGMSQPSGVYFVEIATPQHHGQVRAVFLR
jgi:subtilisin family serine protease